MFHYYDVSYFQPEALQKSRYKRPRWGELVPEAPLADTPEACRRALNRRKASRAHINEEYTHDVHGSCRLSS